MPVDIEKYNEVIGELGDRVKLVAVSKIKPAEDILDMYKLGQRDFGENYVQELITKETLLPKDIRWHFIGHLQSNKVKFIVPFIYLVHGVDSARLLKEINKQAIKCNRIINCLLQVYIAKEETKFGFDEPELAAVMEQLKSQSNEYSNVSIRGLMGMTSFINDMDKVRGELRYLKSLFDKYAGWSIEGHNLSILSMGMSADYKIAIEEGSNMVRIGSLLFGKRIKPG